MGESCVLVDAVARGRELTVCKATICEAGHKADARQADDTMDGEQQGYRTRIG